MIFFPPKRAMRRGFTLVEMLVVVAIIGILAGLISVAAVGAIKNAKRAVVTVEISQLDQALKDYKTKYNEYPPDGTDLTISPTNTTGIPDVVLRHFRQVFPKADISPTTPLGQPNPQGQAQLLVLQTAMQYYNPTTALAFWLGGVPETLNNPKSKLVGFSQNPMYPLTDPSNSRIGPFFEFDFNRLNVPAGAANQMCRTYTAQGANNGYPYVYFRAEIGQKGRARQPFTRGKEEYLTRSLLSVKAVYFNSPNSAVIPQTNQIPQSVKAYFDVTSQSWANPKSFQILFCGFDNAFNSGNLYNTGRWNPAWNPKPANMFYEYNNSGIPGGLDNNASDDQANFLGKPTIGDDLP
jgi:prepilin-type N-terminal cleavage/methylation domain-containing protein